MVLQIRSAIARRAAAAAKAASAADSHASSLLLVAAAAQGKTPGRTSRTCTLAKPEVEFLIRKARSRSRSGADASITSQLRRGCALTWRRAQAEALVGVPRTHMELPQVRASPRCVGIRFRRCREAWGISTVLLSCCVV
jgi:hypothetical protein